MVEKVIKAARELELDIEVRTLERPTRTVAEAAEAVDADPAQIAKSLVFVSDGDPVVAVVSGAHRADMDLLAEAFDCAEVRQASPEEVRAATGFAIGAVAPVSTAVAVGGVPEIGRSLFDARRLLIPFELTAPLLLVAIIGAVTIWRRTEPER